MTTKTSYTAAERNALFAKYIDAVRALREVRHELSDAIESKWTETGRNSWKLERQLELLQMTDRASFDLRDTLAEFEAGV